MKIHFIGIGGIGMSALASISVSEGNKVSGSDKEEQDTTKKLRKMGAKIKIGHKTENLPEKIDIVVITSAIPEGNPELVEAQRRGLKIIERAEYLGMLMNRKKGVAVAGTHGKTTTSTMISTILEKAGLDPSAAIGGLVPEFGDRNWRQGKGEYFVAEACEYHAAFLKLHPFISVITNIEKEHMDYFRNINHIISTFKKFLGKNKKEGFAVIGADNVYTQQLLETEFPFKIHTYGTSEGLSEWQVQNVQEKDGGVFFEAWKNNQKIYDFELRVPGKHNAYNALAAIIVCAEIGINFKTIKDALADFKGAKRRMELLGEKNGVLVIDDYGHHPTEIKSTLEALRNFYVNRKKMFCVFQPHQYSRTKLLFDDFLQSFETPDTVIIPEIYRVRDSKKDMAKVNSKILVDALNEKGTNAIYTKTFEDASEYLKKNVKQGDMIVTMGAGPVNKVAEIFLK